jgi:hypothetical protein
MFYVFLPVKPVYDSGIGTLGIVHMVVKMLLQDSFLLYIDENQIRTCDVHVTCAKLNSYFKNAGVFFSFFAFKKA